MKLENVLNKWELSTVPEVLDEELHDIVNRLATYSDEINELDDLRASNEILRYANKRILEEMAQMEAKNVKI